MKFRIGKIFAAAALLFSSAVATAQDAGKVTRMTDNVYSIFLEGTNSIVVVGDTGVLVTDPSDPARAQTLKRLIAGITDKPVIKVLVTHEHTDHAGGTQEFKEAEIIAQEGAKSVFMLDTFNQLPHKIDVTFQTEYTFNIGPTEVELRYFGPTEGVANTVLYLPKEGIVLLTDMYDEEKTLTEGNSIDATNFVGIRKVYHEVAKWKPRFVLTAHSTNTDPRLMYEHSGYLDALYDAVYARLKVVADDPTKLWSTVQALPNEIKLPAYKSWKNYKDLPRHVYRMAYAMAYNG